MMNFILILIPIITTLITSSNGQSATQCGDGLTTGCFVCTPPPVFTCDDDEFPGTSCQERCEADPLCLWILPIDASADPSNGACTQASPPDCNNDCTECDTENDCEVTSLLNCEWTGSECIGVTCNLNCDQCVNETECEQSQFLPFGCIFGDDGNCTEALSAPTTANPTTATPTTATPTTDNPTTSPTTTASPTTAGPTTATPTTDNPTTAEPTPAFTDTSTSESDDSDDDSDDDSVDSNEENSNLFSGNDLRDDRLFKFGDDDDGGDKKELDVILNINDKSLYIMWGVIFVLLMLINICMSLKCSKNTNER